MVSIPQLATYISYIFIVAVYAYKVWKVARLPVHLRWDLYPIPFGKGHQYGGSYLEEKDWWQKPLPKNGLGGIFYMIKKYLFFGGYFKLKRDYWVSLYPWHIGFYFIVGFHVLTFFCALFMVTTGLVIEAGSANVFGQILYYLSLVVSAVGFILGTIGSVGMLIRRLTSAEMRAYATPSNYFNYIFFFIVFVSGLVSWGFDPTLGTYREFWQSLLRFDYMTAEPATYIHIMLFSLFLVYLPFTRSTHYITKLFAFFSVLWNDKPNLKGSEMEGKISEALDQTVTWSAPHIQSGKKWGEVATQIPESVSGKVQNK
jgi:nitrate reductase gamma subunit